MTIEELVAALKHIKEDRWNAEEDHMRADELLLDYIAQFEGGETVRDAFNDIEKWYT